MGRCLACIALLLLCPGPAGAKVSVDFVGVSKDLERQIKASVEIAAAGDEASSGTIQSLHRRAPDQIRACLRPMGFYWAQVEGDLTGSDDKWSARYRVDAGEPLLVTRAHVALEGPGQGDSILLRAVDAFPLQTGDTLRHDHYETGKKAIALAAAARGYLDARFDSSVMRIDLETHTCEVVLILQTGPRYLYGPVRLLQDEVDPRLLLGSVPFEEGDSLDLAGLRKLQSNLGEAPYFSQAQVELKREEADGLKIPVEVDLQPRKTQRYEFGLGYGTDTGVRGRAEVGFRRLNRRGHNGSIRLEASELERSFSADYRVPPLFPKKVLWTFGFGAGDFSPDWSTTRALRFSVSPSRMVGVWRAALALSYEIDRFEISVTTDTSSLLVLKTEWMFLRADDVRQPRRGARLQLGLRGSHDAVLSSASFIEATSEARGIITLLPDLRLLSRGQINYTGSPDFEELPPSARQVAGGSQSVRGFDYETLGPVDVYGAQVGGQALITSSVEMDFLFIHALGRWGLAVFADAGNAARSFNSFHFETGAGAGVRWSSPVGMLRLDFAWPLSQPGEPYRFHFSMGPDL